MSLTVTCKVVRSLSRVGGEAVLKQFAQFPIGLHTSLQLQIKRKKSKLSRTLLHVQKYFNLTKIRLGAT